MSGTAATRQRVPSGAAVQYLDRISLTVADLGRAQAFYCEALGFDLVTESGSEDEALAELTGIAHLRARSAVLRLGGQEIELVCFRPRGRDYPAERSAADPWFQHFAIVVANMDEAYGVLRHRPDVTPISGSGPERLPPNTGSVTAYKFRDPEGHPLELTMLPLGSGKWHEPHGNAVFLGIDHSAMVVAASDEAVAFYRDLLGMSVAFRSTNRGPEQERLDGLASERVEITVLQPTDPDSPHVELLEYPAAVRRRTPVELQVNDIAATRLILRTNDLGGMNSQFRAGGVQVISRRSIPLGPGSLSILLKDKDGHLLQLTQSTGSRLKGPLCLDKK